MENIEVHLKIVRDILNSPITDHTRKNIRDYVNRLRRDNPDDEAYIDDQFAELFKQCDSSFEDIMME